MTAEPTQEPSSMPSSIPTISPSMSPSVQPSKIPTQSPAFHYFVMTSQTASITPTVELNSNNQTTNVESLGPMYPTVKAATFHYSVMTSQTASITPAAELNSNNQTTNVPSLGPMYPTVKATRSAGARLEVANASKEKMKLLCDGVAMYIDDIMYIPMDKAQQPMSPAALTSEQLVITGQTSFAKESFAPIQKDFELYFKDLMSDEETAQELPLYVLRAGLAGNSTFDGDTAAVSFAEVQHSSDPPVILLSFGDNDNDTPSVPKPVVANVEMASELWLLGLVVSSKFASCATNTRLPAFGFPSRLENGGNSHETAGNRRSCENQHVLCEGAVPAAEENAI
eukprot:scaffold5930_cov177-Cylindrotheca_fusiformis.AAC.3